MDSRATPIIEGNVYALKQYDIVLTHMLLPFGEEVPVYRLTGELSLDSIAKEFYISSYYLSHQFKSVTGFTLTEYIQMTRVRNAQQLLIYTRQRISVIAEQCGFNSFSQFNRVFNKLSGMSPSEFRKQQALSNTASTTLSY